MAAGIGLVVKIAGDTRQAVNDIHDVNRALTGTGQETGRTSKAFGMMKGPALAALAGIAAGAVAAAAAMVEFGKAAWEDHQEAERLAFTLAKIPGVTQDMIDANEAWITQTMFATHVLDTDLREAVGKLAQATGDLGEAQRLAALAADTATGANLEFDAVVQALSKAVAGNTTALMRQMPWLDANKDGTLELDEALQGLEDAYGGAASAAAANDPWTTIQLIFDELKESLGRWILPLFTKLGDWFKDPKNQQKIQEFIEKIGDMAYELGVKLLPYLERFLDWIASPEGQQQMKDWAEVARGIARAIGAIAGAIGTLISWWNKLPKPLRDMLGTSGVGGIGWSGGTGRGVSPASAAAAPTLVAAPATGRASGTTINFYGVVGDPEGAARAVAAVLHGSDRRNARVRTGQPQW